MRALLCLLLAPSLAAADGIKLEAAAKTIADAMAGVDLKTTKAGETLTIGSIAPLDPAKPVDTSALHAALVGAKLKVIDERTQGNGVVITVEGASGARARIAVDQGGGTIVMTAKPTAIKAPGRCVDIPETHHPVHVHSMAINQNGETGEGSTFWDFKTERLHDVDGDGIADAFVPVAKTKDTCPEDVSFRVFVVRGDCGHDVGVIGPGSFAFDAGTAALDPSGFRPFTLSSETSRLGKQRVPEMTTTTRKFAVKRGKYALVDTKKSTGVCHHCATWHCSQN